MSELLDAIVAEQKRLKELGWKPKFRGDTGINICQVMIDNDIELRNQHDRGLVEAFKEIKLTFSEWVKKQLTVEEVEERLNKRKTTSEKQKESDSLFAKRHIARGTKW